MDQVEEGAPQEEMDPTLSDPAEGMPQPGEDLPLEAFNMVPTIAAMPKATEEMDGAAWLEKVGREVVEKCTKDEEDRKDFMDRRGNQLKLYAGILAPLEFPAEGGKAPHLPILLQAMLSLWSRIWDQVCPAKGDVVHVQTTGAEDEERRLRVEKHMNWQVRAKMPDWASGLAASIMQWLLSGSMFRDYCWNPIEKCNQIDHVPIDDMVIPFSETDLHPLMPTVGRLTRKRRIAKHDLLKMEELGFYTGVSDLYDKDKSPPSAYPTGNSNYTDSPVKEAATTIDGVKKPERRDSKDQDAKREIWEQRVWMEVPGLKGIRPVKIHVDCDSKKVLAITLREIDDPVDAARFNEEQKAYQFNLKLLAQGPPPPQPGTPLAPPIAPVTPKQPEPIRKKTLYTTVHYRLFPNPEGFYGLGAGYLLENANDLVDELIADTLIAGKFANMQMGFISKHAQGQLQGDVQMKPGFFKSLDCQPDEMEKAIHFAKFPPPSPTLTQLAELVMNKAESQAANQEILSGEQGGDRETAKSMQIRTGNAMQVVNVMTRLFLEPLKYEFKLMAHGNSVFLDDREEFYVTTPSKQVPGGFDTTKHVVTKADYLEDYDITFTADARSSSKTERVQEANGLLEKIVQTPAILQNPKGQMLLHLAVANVFKEMERPDFLAAWGEAPKPPPPPSPADQFDENAGFINEKDHPVLPDDNHLEHLAKIEDFKMTPHAKALSSTGKQLLERHERAHVAAHYQQVKKGAGNGENTAGPPPGMGPRPGGAGGIPPGRANGAPPQLPPRGVGGSAAPPPGQMPNGGSPGGPV